MTLLRSRELYLLLGHFLLYLGRNALSNERWSPLPYGHHRACSRYYFLWGVNTQRLIVFSFGIEGERIGRLFLLFWIVCFLWARTVFLGSILLRLSGHLREWLAQGHEGGWSRLFGLWEADVASAENALQAVEPLRVSPCVTLVLAIIDEILPIRSCPERVVAVLRRALRCISHLLQIHRWIFLYHLLQVGELVLKGLQFGFEFRVVLQFGVYEGIRKQGQILDNLSVWNFTKLHILGNLDQSVYTPIRASADSILKFWV